MPRILTILGSGETSPTMVTPHQRTFARLGTDVRAVLLDSPYGFQENADELTEKAQQFFRESVGREVEAVTFRKAPPPDPTQHAVRSRHRADCPARRLPGAASAGPSRRLRGPGRLLPGAPPGCGRAGHASGAGV